MLAGPLPRFGSWIVFGRAKGGVNGGNAGLTKENPLFVTWLLGNQDNRASEGPEQNAFAPGIATLIALWWAATAARTIQVHTKHM